jgi:Zn-dependent protease with chaperone function
LAAWHLIVDVAGYHLLPSLSACAVIYVVLSVLLGRGRLDKPADRALFLYAAHIKAALAVWVGESLSSLATQPERFGYFSFRLPAVVPAGPPFELPAATAVMPHSEFATRVLVAVVIAATALLCYRWARIAPLYRSIYESRRAEPGEFPELFRMFDQLVEQTCRLRWLPRPRLMVIRGAPCAAFTMGQLPPIVVLSAGLAEELGERQLRGILAHEIAHVRRLDYLGRWLATILRDILIWNPFVVLWHRGLLDEQEKACDEYAAELLGDPAAVASGIVEVGAYGSQARMGVLALLMARRGDNGLKSLHERLDRLRETAARPRRRSGRSAYLVYSLLLAFFAAQPRVALALPVLHEAVSRAL